MNYHNREHIINRLREVLPNDLGYLENSAQYRLRDGDRVKLNVNRITGRSDYEKTQLPYRKFVEENAQTVFSVRVYRKAPDGRVPLVNLEEAPEWLFSPVDLLLVDCGGD